MDLHTSACYTVYCTYRAILLICAWQIQWVAKVLILLELFDLGSGFRHHCGQHVIIYKSSGIFWRQSVAVDYFRTPHISLSFVKIKVGFHFTTVFHLVLVLYVKFQMYTFQYETWQKLEMCCNFCKSTIYWKVKSMKKRHFAHVFWEIKEWIWIRT